MKAGNHHAFTEIYNRYREKLFTVAANKTNDLAEVEDIVQQIFITIWNRRAELEIRTMLNAYLAVAVKYDIYESIDRRPKKLDPSDEAANAVLLELADDATNQWLEFKELSARLSPKTDCRRTLYFRKHRRSAHR